MDNQYPQTETNVPCKCGNVATYSVSSGVNNPDTAGQPFYACQFGKPPNGCGFFQWADPEFAVAQQKKFEARQKENNKGPAYGRTDPQVLCMLTKLAQKIDIIYGKLV